MKMLTNNSLGVAGLLSPFPHEFLTTIWPRNFTSIGFHLILIPLMLVDWPLNEPRKLLSKSHNLFTTRMTFEFTAPSGHENVITGEREKAVDGNWFNFEGSTVRSASLACAGNVGRILQKLLMGLSQAGTNKKRAAGDAFPDVYGQLASWHCWESWSGKSLFALTSTRGCGASHHLLKAFLKLP